MQRFHKFWMWSAGNRKWKLHGKTRENHFVRTFFQRFFAIWNHCVPLNHLLEVVSYAQRNNHMGFDKCQLRVEEDVRQPNQPHFTRAATAVMYAASPPPLQWQWMEAMRHAPRLTIVLLLLLTRENQKILWQSSRVAYKSFPPNLLFAIISWG